MTILTAQNVNRTYVAKNRAMNADFTSDIIDFKEMALGCVHVKWLGNDQEDGEIAVEASAVPDDDWFDEVDHCPTFLPSTDLGRGAKQTKLFNLGVLGFRYARVKFYKGTNTIGTITIVAQGKKNG
jgi:hypothetical protein